MSNSNHNHKSEIFREKNNSLSGEFINISGRVFEFLEIKTDIYNKKKSYTVHFYDWNKEHIESIIPTRKQRKRYLLQFGTMLVSSKLPNNNRVAQGKKDAWGCNIYGKKGLCTSFLSNLKIALYNYDLDKMQVV